MTINTHKVPTTQWKKWDDEQRALFNGVLEDILRVGSDLFLHPITVQRKLSEEEFSTIAWNSAWTAAHMLRDEITEEVLTVSEGRIISSDIVV